MLLKKRLRWASHVAQMGKTGMHIGRGWESQKERDQWEDDDVGVDNTKMDLREIGWDGVDWIDAAQDREQLRALVNTVLNFWLP
jgi:hypothetical protein